MKIWWLAAGLILSGLLIYLPILWFDFVYLDDNVLILQDASFLSNLANILTIFRQDVFHSASQAAVYYRPIPTLTWMLDFQIAQTAPWFYHLVNLWLHLIATILVLFFCRQFSPRLPAFLAALIFLVHPALTPAVAWVPGRNDSLLTIFALAAFLLLRYFPAKEYWQNGLILLGHLLFLLIALLTKENALLIPLVFLLYLALRSRRQLFTKKTALLILGWLVVVAIYLQLRRLALFGSPPLDWPAIFRHLLAATPALLVYFGKIFLPVNLSVYPILIDSPLFWGIIALAAFVFWLIIRRQYINWRLFGLGAVWFWLLLFSSFVRTDLKAELPLLETRLYLPLPGMLLMLLSMGLFNQRYLVYLLIIAGFFSGIVVAYSQNFRDRRAFWQQAVISSPRSAFSHNNLGAMYFLDTEMLSAAGEFLEARRLNPTEPLVHNNLGLIYFNRGQLELAEQELLTEISLNPDYSDAHFNLALVYEQQKKIDQAEKERQKALKLTKNR